MKTEDLISEILDKSILKPGPIYAGGLDCFHAGIKIALKAIERCSGDLDFLEFDLKQILEGKAELPEIEL